MSKLQRTFSILLTVLLGFAVFSALRLSLKEWDTIGSCPSIGPVPACYLVLLGFASALTGHLAHSRRWGRLLFLAGLGFPTLLALYASIGQIIGFVECPKTDGGTPMCYLSLGICTLCWIVWILSGRHRGDLRPGRKNT